MNYILKLISRESALNNMTDVWVPILNITKGRLNR